MNNTPSSVRPKIFNIYKPVGMTSGDVVYHFKKNLDRPFGKIGHFGTLDPFAEGVLLVGVGGACRLTNFVHDLLPKTYLAKGKLGLKTNTGDATGEVIASESTTWKTFKLSDFDTNLQNFVGEYWQKPPHFSATKHQGKALYKWAREGVEIDKPPVKRVIYKAEMVALEGDFVTLRVTVSTGTYIRTLFEDLTEKLGTLGHLTELKRESIGQISVNEALVQEDWPMKGIDQNQLPFLSMPELLPLNKFILQSNEERLFANGQELAQNRGQIEQANQDSLRESPFFWVYGPQNKLIGLGELNQGFVKTRFNLPQNNP